MKNREKSVHFESLLCPSSVETNDDNAYQCLYRNRMGLDITMEDSIELVVFFTVHLF